MFLLKDVKDDLIEPLEAFEYTRINPINYRPFKKKSHDVAMGGSDINPNCP